MNVEDRLRDALGAEAGTATPTHEGWGNVRATVGAVRRRRRRQRAFAGLAATAAGVAAITLALGQRPGDREQGVASITGSQGPYVVAAEADRVTVRSAADGQPIRVIAEGDEAAGVSRLAMSRDGATVYFARKGPPTCRSRDDGSDSRRDEIVSAPIAGGPIRVVARGRSPVFLNGPDQGFLVYESDSRESGCGGGELRARDLRFGASGRVDAPRARSITPLRSSKDGFGVLVAAANPNEEERFYILTPIPSDDVAVQPLRLPSTSTPVLIQSSREDGAQEPLLAFADRANGLTDIRTLDSATGRTRSLFEVTGDASLLDALAGDDLQVLVRIDDAIGAWSESAGLVRWDLDARVTDAVLAGGPRRPPSHLVVLTRGGDLVLRRTDGGAAVRTLMSDLPYGYHRRIASSPDGRYVYLDDFTPRPANRPPVDRSRAEDPQCPEHFEAEWLSEGMVREIVRLEVSTGRVQPLAYGSGPTLSSDGTKLAYVATSLPFDCGADDVLVVRDLRTGQERRWEAKIEGEGLWEPRWSPDTFHIQVIHTGPADVHLVELDAGNESLRLVEGYPFRFGVPEFLTDMEVLVVDDERDGESDQNELITLDAETGERGRTLLRHNEIGAVLGTDPTGYHVLLGSTAGVMRYSVGALDPVKLVDGDVVAATFIDLPRADESKRSGPSPTANASRPEGLPNDVYYATWLPENFELTDIHTDQSQPWREGQTGTYTVQYWLKGAEAQRGPSIEILTERMASAEGVSIGPQPSPWRDGDHWDRVSVRGHEGWLLTRRCVLGPTRAVPWCTDRSKLHFVNVRWFEEPRVAIYITAPGVSRRDVLRVAESVRL